MEENIKILKDTLEKYCYKNCKGEIDDICKECKRLKAIENLIKGYRELEGELNKLNSYILINGIDEGLKTATQIKLENQSQYLHQKQVENLKEKIEYLKANSILKSKIKENIEETKKAEADHNENYIGDMKDYYFDLGRIIGKRQGFEELLEEK